MATHCNFYWIMRHSMSVGYVFVNFFGWGLAGAWYAVFIDQFIRDMIILLRFRSGRWKNIRIA